MNSVKFYTVGCKVNQYETQAMRESFLNDGYEEPELENPANVYVINTCTVTSKADRDSRRYIRLAHKTNPKAKIIVTGCLAESDEAEIRAISGVTQVVKKNGDIKMGTPCFKSKVSPFFLQISTFHNHSRAFVKIQDGCNNFCSYCKVPLVRGRSRSRDVKSILEEVHRLIENGFKEIVLCGICLGEWGRDLSGKLELSDLVEKIESINKEFRIRLSSIEPKHVTDRLIKKIALSSKLCNHLHIPLQSGDDTILKLMNRPYKAKDYIKKIKSIKKLIPDFSLTTDVLVGFPGEDKSHFYNTVKVLKKAAPSRLHVFQYSPRSDTRAYDYKSSISDKEAKSRVKKLILLNGKFSLKYRRKFVKKNIRILVENKRDKLTQLLTGYSDTYIKATLEGPDSLYGKLINATTIKLDKKTTFCIPSPNTP